MRLLSVINHHKLVLRIRSYIFCTSLYNLRTPCTTHSLCTFRSTPCTFCSTLCTTLVELACKMGGSSTFTTILIAEHGLFFEVKSDFHDHIHHYCWRLGNLLPTCPCSSNFTLDHVQIFNLFSFINMHHNDPTTFLTHCMKEIHHDVEVELPLLPLTGETFRHLTANTEPDAQADIRVRGFWTNSRNAYFLIQECSIPTHEAINPEACSPCIGGSGLTRNVSMVS